MKKYLLLIVALVSTMPLSADTKDKTNPSADRYNVTNAEGILPFGKSYYELNGRPSGANGNFYSSSNANWSIKKWPDSNTKKHIATYLHMPACTTNASIEITTTGKVGFILIVTSMETGEEIARNSVEFAKGTHQWVELLPQTQIPADGWYKFDLACTKGVTYVGEFFNWKFEKTGSTDRIYTADYMSSPSVHLSGWKTTDPSAPANGYYDWAYQEVMVPQSSAVVGTYCMSLGILHGYMGIQIDSDNDYPIIFSMWDNGSTDEDPNLPAYLRSGALDWNDGVIIARFANEGTGAQAKYRYGKNWVPGKWVKFITNARPEIVNVEIDDPANPGKKKTITYTNTLCSAWYMADGIDTDWHYIATIRQSGANNYFDGWYSFLENYNWPTGQWQRKAYYRNGGVHSLTNGKWYHANSVGFGHTDGGSLYGDRRDYGQGLSEDFDGTFFMTTGGYHNNPVQNAKVVPLQRNYMPVDQETLDRLTARVDEAIRKEQVVAMKERVSNACEIYPQTRFKVIAKSDEATNEGTGNVATAVFDGNEDSYWHSKWSGGETAYPHTLTIQVEDSEEFHLGQISLYQKRASSYRAKQLTVYYSQDNKSWTKQGTYTLEDMERPNVELTSPISAPYIKLSFDKGYGNNLLMVNEIYFKSSPSIEDLKAQAAELLSMADQFGGYSSEDLAPLKEAYADGAVSEFDVLSSSLNTLASTAQPLKFGRVDAMKHLSSFKAYQLHGLDRQGDLAATPEGEVVYAGLATPTNVMSPYSNWLLLYSTKTQQYYVYNLGAKKYLKSGTPFTLVDTPQAVTLTYTMGGFRLGTSATWEVRDNYKAQPAFEVPNALLESIEYEAGAAERQSKYAAASGFLAAAQSDMALEIDKSLAGEYDVTPLVETLGKTSPTVDEVAQAYDEVRASVMPRTDRYYRIISQKRPTAGSMENYLSLSGTGTSQSFSVKNTSEFGPAPSSSLTPETFRLYVFEKAANDTTFYVRSTANDRYLLTQTTDNGVSALANEYRLLYEGQRLFRLQNITGKYMTVNSTNKLAETTSREDNGRFYFKEVTELENAISVGESGYSVTTLPVSVVLPDGVEALVPTGILNGLLQVVPLNDFLAPADADVLPAATPVVLRTADRQPMAPVNCAIYYEELSPVGGATTQNDVMRTIRKANILSGTTCRTTITKSDYIFDETALTMQPSPSSILVANKVYLSSLRVPFDCTGELKLDVPEITSVNQIEATDGTARSMRGIYDMQGRTYHQRPLHRGLYIEEGCKKAY